MDSSHTYNRYRAPQRHGDLFAQPSLGDAGKLLSDNRACLGESDQYWTQFRIEARQQLVSDAIRYTSNYRSVSFIDSLGVDPATVPIVMAGHQPTLFHPGVWFKNFALDHIARKHSSLAINLVIDNDVMSSSALRVPSLDSKTGLCVSRTVAYDRYGGGVPYEQSEIQDRDQFDRFDDTVVETVSPIVDNPSVVALWKHARQAIRRCGFAGCALAQARHALEGELGLETLELPMGVVCRSRSFMRFFWLIISQIDRFADVYHQEVSRYRDAHGIRSASHPVSDLKRDGLWFETPFWVYGDRNPRRRSLWVRIGESQLFISDRADTEHSIRIDQSDERVVDALFQLLSSDFKIRPRALMTTMYARLVLSDLFIHGIGGGKYDQLGDAIANRYFGIQPPRFMVVSATVRLPGMNSGQVEPRIRSVKRSIRDTRFQPERFAEQYKLDALLLSRKNELLNSVPTKGKRQQWHHEVDMINRQLSDSLINIRMDLENELVELNRQKASLAILKSREHSFCLYPVEYMTSIFGGFLKG